MQRATILAFAMAVLGSLMQTESAQAAALRQVTAELPPLSMDVADHHGYAYDVVAEAHRRLGLPFTPEYLPWARAQAVASSGHGILIFSLARTAERELRFSWIAELIDIPACIISVGGVAPTDSLSQAKKLTHIGVAQGTPWADFLLKSGFTNLDQVPAEETNARKLIAGSRIDGWYTLDVRALYYLKRAGYSGPIIRGAPLQHDHSWLAASLDFDPKLASALRRSIEAIRADGTASKIYAKYF